MWSILCGLYYVRKHIFAINELITFCCLHKYTIAAHDISILLWTMYCSNIMYAYMYRTLLFLTKYLLKSLLASLETVMLYTCIICTNIGVSARIDILPILTLIMHLYVQTCLSDFGLFLIKGLLIKILN